MIIVQMGIALSDNSASKGIYGIAHKTNLVVWVKKKMIWLILGNDQCHGKKKKILC